MIYLEIDTNNARLSTSQIDHILGYSQLDGIEVYLSIEDIVQERGLEIYRVVETDDPDEEEVLVTFDYKKANQASDEHCKKIVDQEFVPADYEAIPELTEMDDWEKLEFTRENGGDSKAILIQHLKIGGQP